MNVIYEDDWLVVVDKPHGQHTQETAQGNANSLLAEAQALYGKDVRLVHRLDRDAGGLLVLARHKEAASRLSAALRAHEIHRTYRALIAVPLPVGTEGTIDKPLKWSGGRCWVDDNGTHAVTHYRVVDRRPPHTELECRLETGRMHQIRVHLSTKLGAIVGDRKYGGARADRLMLRAVHLMFFHPEHGHELEFSAPGFD